MSETTPETPHAHPHKSPEPNTGKATTGKTNILTKDYGPLKGWVWGVLGIGTIILILIMRKKAQAAGTSSATTTPDTTTANGSSSDYGTSSDNGGSSGGYYGGGSDSSSMPVGQLNVPIPNSGSATGSTPASPGFIVSTTVDEGIAKNDGVPISHLFVGGTTAKGYTRPVDLANDPGLPGEVYLGQAGTGAPAGSTVLQGAQRAQTDTEIKNYLASHPISGT